MLKIIYKLSIFFEDCYREVSVREYAREVGVSPPTASKLLRGFVDEGILTKREERGFLLFRINKGSGIVRDLSRIYWKGKLKELILFLEGELFFDSVVLFGSLSKLEVTGDSDIDLVVFGKSESEVDLGKFEKMLGREVQIFRFGELGKVNKELRTNILNGYVLEGYLE